MNRHLRKVHNGFELATEIALIINTNRTEVIDSFECTIETKRRIKKLLKLGYKKFDSDHFNDCNCNMLKNSNGVTQILTPEGAYFQTEKSATQSLTKGKKVEANAANSISLLEIEDSSVG